MNELKVSVITTYIYIYITIYIYIYIYIHIYIYIIFQINHESRFTPVKDDHKQIKQFSGFS